MTTGYGESSELLPYIIKVQGVAPDPKPGMFWLDTSSSSVGGVRIMSRITVSTVIDDTFDFILVDASGGAVTITLPPITIDGKVFDIKKVDSSANAVTIDGDGTEPIDDGLTAVLTVQYEELSIAAELSTTKWWIGP